MKARLLVALAAGLLVGAADPAPDLGEVQSLEIPPGSKWVETDRQGLRWIHEFGRGGVWATTSPEGSMLHQEYILDPRSRPPRIDAAGEKGLYRLEGNRLLICVGEGVRPTTFAHRPEAGQYIYILKRLK